MDAPSSELAAAGALAGPPPQGVEAFLAAAGPLIDLRSPAEFAQGHIPGATNLPLFNNDERAEIGTLYKQQGRQAAVLHGLALVGPRMVSLGTALLSALAEHRTASSAAAPPHNAPCLRLHCWRGGMRSGSVAWLAGQLDLPVLLLGGGYKAYRHWVLELFERSWPLRLLGGRTGCGKTDLLLALRQQGVAVLDLEGRAHHRGSSFGALGLPPQPSSEHYENLLAADLASLQGADEIWLEAESSQVGRCRIPAGLWRQMKEAPALEIQRPLEQRVSQLVAIYGLQDPAGLAEATQRIAKRLGPQRTALALEAIAAADWASACRQMLDYYDRCYDHDLSSHAVQAVDLGELAPTEAAGLLLEQGLVRVRPCASKRGS
ncbi:tRNA 2-selenouridine(34) synthase MnmH [Vulcanococcus limneticus]|uniref:tRNA 2-selenouridine(34) synthase MnmH n=1 Tax=Vulcanococcus limneticus TaxID=2170428 RepID=UPI00398C0B99